MSVRMAVATIAAAGVESTIASFIVVTGERGMK